MTNEEVRTKGRDVILQEHTEYILSTVDAQGRPRSRYMGGLVPVEGSDFDFYMITFSNSRKVEQLARVPFAQVLMARDDWSEIVSLSGTARLVADPAVKAMCWEKMPGAHRYFTGKDDSNFAVLQFSGEELEYEEMGAMSGPQIVRL